jgi:hypothetical protein
MVIPVYIIVVIIIIIVHYYYYYYYYYWLDSPVWTLAFFRSFSCPLFTAAFHQFFVPRALVSRITSSSHLSLGLLIVLVPSGLVWNTLTVLLFSICIICPAKHNLIPAYSHMNLWKANILKTVTISISQRRSVTFPAKGCGLQFLGP